MLLGIHEIHDASKLAKFEQDEAEYPSPRKELDDRYIYLSQRIPLTRGEPKITGLSEARFGEIKYTDLIMPSVYRAPEVILGISWSYPVGVWALGMVVSFNILPPNSLERIPVLLWPCYTNTNNAF